MDERGQAGAAFLTVALFISALGAGLSLQLGGLARYQGRSAAAYEERAGLEREARRIAGLMAAGLGAEADSPLDPLWPELSAAARAPSPGPAEIGGEAGETLSVRDLSSALDLNFVRADLLENGAIAATLGFRSTAGDLQRYREERGLSCRLEHYAPFFDLAEGRPVGCHGWANINTADELALRLLYRSATGSEEGARLFREKVQSLRRLRRVVQREELAGLLGSAALFPIVCAEPQLNVNYIDRDLALALLRFPGHGIAEPERRCAELMDLRSLGPVREEDIARILGVAPGHAILQFLGSRTWFWELRVQRGRSACVLVLARRPGVEAADGAARLDIVETRFEG